MDALKDFWASVVAFAHERTTNPFTVALVVAWGLWNYRFLMVVFMGDAEPAERFALIEGMYSFSDWYSHFQAYIAPMASAGLYVFAYPPITLRIVKFHRERQVRLANAVKKIEGERLLTQDEAIAMTRRHEAQVRQERERAAAAGANVTELRQALDASEEELRRLRSASSNQPEKQGELTSSISKTAKQIGAELLSKDELQQMRKKMELMERQLETLRDEPSNPVFVPFTPEGLQILKSLQTMGGIGTPAEVAHVLPIAEKEIEKTLTKLYSDGYVDDASGAFGGPNWRVSPYGRDLIRRHGGGQ